MAVKVAASVQPKFDVFFGNQILAIFKLIFATNQNCTLNQREYNIRQPDFK